MKTKSALVGLLMLMIGSGCSSSDKTAEYQEKAANGDNVTQQRSGGIGVWPFLMGYLMGNRGGANNAVANPSQQEADQKNKQNAATNNNRGAGQQSDLTSRGSKSMRGSMGS